MPPVVVLEEAKQHVQRKSYHEATPLPPRTPRLAPKRRSPVRGDETGLLLGSFGGTSDGGGIHHEDSDIARLS
jgi:hypothetical protein